jgi:serine/threonine-protein kinase
MTDAHHCDACTLPRSRIDPRLGSGDLVDGRYRIVTALGRGGFGVVYRAEDVHLKRYVAIKLAHEDMRDRVRDISFESEAAAMAAIHHPNVALVHAFGMHGAAPFFVMEHVAGASLEKSLRAHRDHGAHVPMHTALHVVQQIALGLGAAHAAGLVHRDVKPDNVIIEEHTGRPVLVDFGIAVSVKRSIHDVVGTAAYMPPEASSPGERLGPASDQYSLACMTFELLTGHQPFEATSQVAIFEKHLDAPRPSASAYRPELAPCDAVLQRGMAVDPAGRWPSCIAFADALADVTRGLERPPTEAVAWAPLPLAARRVLVVEDDPVAVKLLSRAAQVAFADADVAVSRARTGPDAVANAERATPSLVVLDYHLPGIDGVEVLSRIRAMPGGDRVAVIVASGTVGASERWRFSILGVQDFIDKPLDFAHTVDRIAAIGRRRGWIVGATAPTAGRDGGAP